MEFLIGELSVIKIGHEMPPSLFKFDFHTHFLAKRLSLAEPCLWTLHEDAISCHNGDGQVSPAAGPRLTK